MNQNIEIRHSEPSSTDAIKLFRAGHEAMQSAIPKKNELAFSIDVLKASHIKLLLAYKNGVAAGCCAIFKQEDYSELKRLFVTPAERGQGIAERLIECVEHFSQSQRSDKVMLESGAQLHGAHRLYLRLGYTKRDAFGIHKNCPESLFFEKKLSTKT